MNKAPRGEWPDAVTACLLVLVSTTCLIIGFLLTERNNSVKAAAVLAASAGTAMYGLIFAVSKFTKRR